MVVNLRHKPIGICEIKYHDNKNIIKIIAYSYEYSSLISFEIGKNNKPSVHTYTTSACNILEIERNNYIINNAKAGYITKDFFDKTNHKIIFKYSYYEGMKIDEKLLVFTSNVVMPNGKDRLIIYDKISNDILYELEGYSFSLSPNSLLLIKNNKNLNKDKFLICACKQYSSYQKNGILLINATGIENKQDIFNGFCETGNFEPYCLSQILLVNKSNEKNSGKIYDTNYFFVGGFDQERGTGAIKLYKINFENEAYKTTINFIQDIFLDEDKNIQSFNGAITSIIQDNDTGNFLISCSNGNIYLFSPANINYFLYYDEEEKKGSNYEEIENFDENSRKSPKQKVNNRKMLNKLLDVLESTISFNLDFLR